MHIYWKRHRYKMKSVTETFNRVEILSLPFMILIRKDYLFIFILLNFSFDLKYSLIFFIYKVKDFSALTHY